MIELDFFGQAARLDHIGIAVKSIREVSPLSETTIDPIQKVSVSFVLLNGIKLELIEPYGDNSPVTESLKKGVKILHLCYAVTDIESAINNCRKHSLHCIAPPIAATAFDGRRIAWLYSNKYGLFELLELRQNETALADT